MLSDRYGSAFVGEHLCPAESFKPYPTVENRSAWNAVPDVERAYWLQAAGRAAGSAIAALPATLFLTYARSGDRERYQSAHFSRRIELEALVAGECFEASGRFLDPIADRIWAICEESFWGVPAHIGMQSAGVTLPDVAEPVVDLFAAETANLLAWASFLLGERLDEISPLLRARIRQETEWRIFAPLRDRSDFPWMGLERTPAEGRVNNWNPWICSNWLAATLLLESDRDRRRSTVHRILTVLDRFLEPYPADGGCDEGPGYWGLAAGSLFDALELARTATDGAIDVYAEEKVRNMARFIYLAHIADDYYVNFADASAIIHPNEALVYLFGIRVTDSDMIRHGLRLMQRSREGGRPLSSRANIDRQINFQRLLRAVFAPEILEQTMREGSAATSETPPLIAQHWLPDTEFFVAREHAGSAEGFFLAAKGGHNRESHNHNDVGTCLVYCDGKPLLIDAGVGTYVAKTFSQRRYEIWTMQSAYHNFLPRIDGVDQHDGESFAAREARAELSESRALLELDIAGAYPDEAGVEYWRRSIVLDRGACVEISDSFRLRNPQARIEISVLTPSDVDGGSAGELLLYERELGDGRRSAAARLLYPESLSAEWEWIALDDPRLRRAWGDGINRIRFSARADEIDALVFRIRR